MKISVSGWTVGGFNNETPVLEAAKLAQDAGFDAIELCFGAGELSPDASDAALTALKEGIEGMGFAISSMATGFYWAKSLSSPDEAERKEAVEFTKAYINAANVLEVDAILVVPGAVNVPFDPSRPVVPSKTVWDISQRSIKELLPFAEKAGVAICVENVWNKFLTGPFELAQYIDSFQSPFVKSYFDAGNVLLTGYPEHWIEILGGKRIGRVHVKNFTAHDGGGTLADFTDSLMKGTLNWEAVLGALKNAGYDGYVTPEMLVSDKGLPDPELARQVAKDMRKLLEQYG